MSKKPQHVCPHCEGAAQIRSSRSVTLTYRVIYLQCLDVECGHTYAAEMTITHTIAPSRKPNPRVRIPLGERGRRVPAPDVLPTPANDVVAPTAAGRAEPPAAMA